MITHKLPPAMVGRELRVHVAGAGGTGSQVITGLARMHLALQAVGHPGLEVDVSDPDTVSESNVGRQLFSPSDVGQPKSHVLVNRINCYYGFRWKSHQGRYGSPGLSGVGHPDFLIGCVDSVAARRELNITNYRGGYWLDLGNRDRTGQVVLGQKKSAHTKDDPTRPLTFLELFPALARGRVKEDNAPSCSLAESLERQDLFINQAVATYALQLLWSFIRQGETAIQGYYINLETGRTVPIPVPQPPAAGARSIAPRGKPLVKVLAGKENQKSKIKNRK